MTVDGGPVKLFFGVAEEGWHPTIRTISRGERTRAREAIIIAVDTGIAGRRKKKKREGREWDREKRHVRGERVYPPPPPLSMRRRRRHLQRRHSRSWPPARITVITAFRVAAFVRGVGALASLGSCLLRCAPRLFTLSAAAFAVYTSGAAETRLLLRIAVSFLFYCCLLLCLFLCFAVLLPLLFFNSL